MNVHRLGRGAVLSFTLFSFYRLLNARFPLDMVSVLILTLPLAGVALAPGFQKRFQAWRHAHWVFAATAVVFLAATFLNSQVSFHFLAATNYYPYPKPQRVGLQWILLGVSLLFSVPFFSRLGMDAGSEGRPRSRQELLLGLLIGWLLSYAAVTRLGAPAALAAGAVASLWLYAGFLPSMCGAMVVLGLGVIMWKQPKALLTWRTGDYRVLESTWSGNYFLNFISFNDDRCLGGVYSYLMLWQVCDDTSLLQKEQRLFHQIVGEGRKSALILGRVDGTTALTLESPSNPFERVVAVEVDPVVVERMTGPYARYNQHLFSRPGFEAVAMDWRQFIEKDTERYDIIALDGLGIRLLVEPLSMVFHEDSVYTRESFRTLFRDRLQPDGILIINWGSSLDYEAIPLVENFPGGVKSAVFWTTFNDYPFMGLPVFLIAASSDGSSLEAVAEKLRGQSVFREVAMPERLVSRNSDDSPFLQRFIQLHKIAYPLAGLCLAVLLLFGIRGRSKGLGRVVQSALLGTVVGLGVCLIMARASRWVHPEGPGPGFLALGTAFLLGCLASGLLKDAGEVAGKRSFLKRGAVGAIALVGSMTGSSPLWLSLAAFGFGFGVTGLSGRDSAGNTPVIVFRLALILGLLIAQISPVYWGYSASGWVCAFVLMGVAAWIGIRGRC